MVYSYWMVWFVGKFTKVFQPFVLDQNFWKILWKHFCPNFKSRKNCQIIWNILKWFGESDFTLLQFCFNFFLQNLWKIQMNLTVFFKEYFNYAMLKPSENDKFPKMFETKLLKRFKHSRNQDAEKFCESTCILM